MEGILVEINLRKKWSLLASYKSPSLLKRKFFDDVGNRLEFYCKSYENVIAMGDWNTLDSDEVLG